MTTQHPLATQLLSNAQVLLQDPNAAIRIPAASIAGTLQEAAREILRLQGMVDHLSQPTPPAPPDQPVVRIMPGFGVRDVTAMLEVAKNADLREVVILGHYKGDGSLFVSASSDAYRDISWLLRRAEAWMSRQCW